MILCLFVVVFFAVILTGPAGLEWREKRRLLRDAPSARVLYLPSSACRPATTTASELEDARRKHVEGGCADGVAECGSGRCDWVHDYAHRTVV